MKIISRNQKANLAEDAWYKQYSNSSMWEGSALSGGKTKREIHESLVSLGVCPTAEEVNSVIGNTSWTDCRCDECGKQVEKVVQLGQEPDYESSTANICFPCLKKAVNLK